MFNALKYTEELEKAGFSRNEAEASLKVLIEVMNENFATKSDLHTGLKDLEHRVDQRFQILTQVMESRFQSFESRMDSKFQSVDAKFQLVDARFSSIDSKFQELEYKLTIKLGTMMVLAVGLTATMVQLFK
jgi:hypothetical protein